MERHVHQQRTDHTALGGSLLGRCEAARPRSPRPSASARSCPWRGTIRARREAGQWSILSNAADKSASRIHTRLARGPLQRGEQRTDRVGAASARSEPIRPGFEPGLPLGFQRVTDPCLVAAVHEHGNAERRGVFHWPSVCTRAEPAAGPRTEIVRCTRTAISALACDDSATCPSIPAVRRPALRCVTCRTLTSVFDQDRSIIFCRDRTLAQSCSRVALKILRRSRRYVAPRGSASRWRPSRARPRVRSPSRCPTCPFGSEGLDRHQSFKGSPAHVSTLSGPATRAGIRPVIRGRSAEGPTMSPGFLSPFGHRHSLLGHPVPAEEFRPPHGRPTEALTAWTPTGFPRSAHTRYDRGGRPLYPEASGVHTTGEISPVAARRSSSGQALSPRSSSHLRSCRLRGIIKGSLTFTRPAFPSPGAPPDGTGALGLLPWASHPDRQDLRRTPGRGLASNTDPELRDRHRRPPIRELTRNVRPRVARPRPSRPQRTISTVLPPHDAGTASSLRENHQRPNDSVLTPHTGGHDIPSAINSPGQPAGARSFDRTPREVPRAFRTVHPIGWAIWKGEIVAPT